VDFASWEEAGRSRPTEPCSELAHADEDVLVVPVGSSGVDNERRDDVRQARPALRVIMPEEPQATKADLTI